MTKPKRRGRPPGIPNPNGGRPKGTPNPNGGRHELPPPEKALPYSNVRLNAEERQLVDGVRAEIGLTVRQLLVLGARTARANLCQN
jgi:hypothetical protein